MTSKTIVIIVVVTINLLIIIGLFVSTCCFFPSLKITQLSQSAWLLARDGTVIGSPNKEFLEFRQDSGFFQINNTGPQEELWRCYLPVTMTDHGMKKVQISWYVPPNAQEKFRDSMESDSSMGVNDINDTLSDFFSSPDIPEKPYYCLESLDPLTNEVLSRMDLRSEYDISNKAEICMCIPPHLIVFTNEEPVDRRSLRPYKQSVKSDNNPTWTNLVFLENYSNDPMEWEKRTFDYYAPGDAYLMCWEYSPDHQGCFLLFEVYPKKCNELIYYHVAKQEVMAKVQIQGYQEEFQVFSILNDRKTIMVYNENRIEFYSLPYLKFVKMVSHHELKLDYAAPITASTDLRYVAYGNREIFVLDTASQDIFVIDKRHYDKINMSPLYILLYGNDASNGFPISHANFCYDMQQLIFLKDKHILTGMTYNDNYYQWDVDAGKRIFHKNLAVTARAYP